MDFNPHRKLLSRIEQGLCCCAKDSKTDACQISYSSCEKFIVGHSVEEKQTKVKRCVIRGLADISLCLKNVCEWWSWRKIPIFSPINT